MAKARLRLTWRWSWARSRPPSCCVARPGREAVQADCPRFLMSGVLSLPEARADDGRALQANGAHGRRLLRLNAFGPAAGRSKRVSPFPWALLRAPHDGPPAP